MDAGLAADEVPWPPYGDAAAALGALGPGDQTGEAARLRLRALLLGAVWFELDRRREQLPVSGASANSLARQAAEAAYVDLVGRLGSYHGQSRFSTWAAKFAIHHAAVAARATEANAKHHGREARP